MPRDFEIKARVDDLDDLAAREAAIATSGPTPIAQDDTFFPCPAGRLKLREFADGTGQLIFYQRADEEGPKTSFYVLSPTDSPASLRAVLTQARALMARLGIAPQALVQGAYRDLLG